MKIPSILKMALCAAGFSAFALMGGARAQVLVNVNLTSDGIPSATLNGTASNTSTVAPLAYTGNVWNDNESGNLTPSGSNLLYSNGSGSSGIGYSLAGAANAVTNSISDAGIVMFQGGLFTSPGSMTLTITGLQVGQNYTMAFVSQYNTTTVFDGGVFSIAGQPTLTSTGQLSTPADTFTNGTNYVEFTGVQANGGGDVVVNIAPTTYGYDVGLLNGFQIEAESVPEPSSVALIGLGALGFAFLVVRRRHRLV